MRKDADQIKMATVLIIFCVGTFAFAILFVWQLIQNICISLPSWLLLKLYWQPRHNTPLRI